eukprot:13204648-Heterocapsa_arctica.AAC.1
MIAKLISLLQNGFISGRKILDNVLEIGAASMKVSIGEGNGALILFDFEAAFPSLSQEFLHEILRRSGLPPHIRL